MSTTGIRFGHGLLSLLLQLIFLAVVFGATLLWGWVGLAASAVVSLVVQLLVSRALARSRARRFPPEGDPLTPRSWRPRVSVGGIVSGIVLGFGGALFLQ